MSDELRDRLHEAIIPAMIEHGPDGHIDGYEEIAQAVIDALQIEERQGRYVLGWRPDDPEPKPF